jgi:murein L,D-transpeptidase YcbB/YkuD
MDIGKFFWISRIRGLFLFLCFSLFLILAGAPASADPTSPSLPLRLDETVRFHIWQRDQAVVTLRRMLDFAGIKAVSDTVEERYDLKLLDAVRQFQRHEALKNTGLPNPETIARLNQIAAKAAEASKPQPGLPSTVAGPPAASLRLDENTQFRIWLRDESVLTLRRMLDIADIKPALDTVAERYDLQLLEAVRQFQRRESLKNSGLPNAETIARLNQIAASPPAKKPEPEKPAAAAPATSQQASGPMPSSAAKQADTTKTSGKKEAGSSVACEAPAAGQAGVPELPMIDQQSVARQRETIARYEAAAAAGGFPVVKNVPKSGFCVGQDHPAVAGVVAHLVADNYLSSNYRGTTVYHQAVVDAIRQFQDAHGLVASGRIGSDTLAAMNAPIGERIAALRASLPRLEKILARPELTSDQVRVVVNVASASVQALTGKELLAGYKAIVGRDERESPEFISTIPDVLLAPTWHAPQSIVRRDISQHVRADPGYLEKNNMRVLRNGTVIDASRVNWRSGPLPDVEQRPGRTNALGPIRFGIGNGGRYYLHGTSNPALLDLSLAKRFLSSGCVRLADPAQLAAILLRGTPAADGSPWTVEKLRQRIDAHEGGWDQGQRIRLAKPVPVIWTYLTAWVSRDGRTHFRPDRYERQPDATAQIPRLPLDQVRQGDQAGGAKSI